MMHDVISSRIYEDGLVLITCDTDSAGDLISRGEVLLELRKLIERLVDSGGYRAIALRLGGEGETGNGYPIEELLGMEQNEVRRFCFESQDTVRLIRGLEVPTYCLMNGNISGLSLELALSCGQRIMSLSSGSRIMFPEIGMGIIPPLGGVFDLIRLLGVPRVLELFESSAVLSPQGALELGIVHHLARTDVLEEALSFLSNQEDPIVEQGVGEGPESLADLLTRLWSENRIRKLVQLSSAVRRTERSFNPGSREAFLSLVEMIREGLSSGREEGLMVGARNFTDLLSSPSSRSILSLSLKRSRLEWWIKEKARSESAEGKIITVLGDSERSVYWAVKYASKGFAVRYVTGDLRKFSTLLENRLAGQGGIRGWILPTTHIDNLDSSGLVIAACGYNDLGKFGSLVRKAINGTSSGVPVVVDTAPLPFLVSEIPLESKHRVYGISSIGPGEINPLIELSLSDDIQEDGLDDLLPFFTVLDTLVVIVREGPAGLTRRILTAYLTEALRLVEEGIGFLRVEEAALAAGFPVGPFWILDNVGLSEYLESARFLRLRLGDRFEPPSILSRLQQLGISGRSEGKGLYVHSDGTPYLNEGLSPSDDKHVDPARYGDIIQERLLYAVMGEAMRAFKAGITPHPEFVDTAVDYLGIFPSHLGGPLYHASLTGTAQLVRVFEKLHRNFGVQFEPPELLYTTFGERVSSPIVSFRV